MLGRTTGFIAVFALLMAASFSTKAQTTAGTLTGNVLDPNGAAVANATVAVTDNATNKTRNATTNDQGTFTVPQLEFGTYTVTVTATGF